MIRRPSRSVSPRKGAAVVEMAVVCVMFFTLLLGIFEYCRFLFVYNLSQNAARDAARYLVVKTNGGNMPGDPTTIATLDDLKNLVLKGTYLGKPATTGMGGLEKNLDGAEVTVFTVDPAGLAESPPVIRPLKDGTSAVPWNSAGFGQKIAVRISGLYRPTGTGLLFLPSSIPFDVTVMISSEGN